MESNSLCNHTSDKQNRTTALLKPTNSVSTFLAKVMSRILFGKQSDCFHDLPQFKLKFKFLKRLKTPCTHSCKSQNREAFFSTLKTTNCEWQTLNSRF